MNTQKMYDLKEMLCRELDTIAGKGEMSAGDLEAAHKLTATIKNIDKMMMFDNGSYSGGEWSADMRGSYGYDSGNSNATRVRGYMRSNNGRNGSYRGNYNGYSRDSILDHLSELMDGASEHEKQIIRDCIDRLR